VTGPLQTLFPRATDDDHMTAPDEAGGPISDGRGRSEGRVGRAFRRRTAAVFALGFVGILGLATTLALAPDALPAVPDVPRPVLILAAVIQPAILVLLAAAIGALLAPPLGLRSHVVDRVEGTRAVRSLASEAPVAVPVGLGVGVLLVALDVLVAGRAAGGLAAGVDVSVATVLASAPLRFLYGGITEEVLLRWGAMTLLVWLGWRLRGRPSAPSAVTVWVAICVSALAFGVAHLPAAATAAPLTAAVVARIVLLNALAGVAYGWLYWRTSLEGAMVGHAATHVVLLGVSVVLVV